MGWVSYRKCLKFSDICTHFNSVQFKASYRALINKFNSIILKIIER